MNHPALFAAALLGGVGAWLFMRRRPLEMRPAEGGLQRAETVPTKSWAISSKVPTLCQSPSASTGLYLAHLSNAAAKVLTIQNGAETPEEAAAVNQAYADLGAPIDTLTAQKDLNVLGATPALVEDGALGPKTKDAIVSFQHAMDINPSGVLDSDTARALRRAVVAVTMQTSPLES